MTANVRTVYRVPLPRGSKARRPRLVVKTSASDGAGQIGFDPASMQLAEGVEAQIHRVFQNLAAIAKAANLDLARAVRITVYLTDLAHFAKVNEIMAQYVPAPFPSRAAVGVASLPRGAVVEIDCILHAG